MPDTGPSRWLAPVLLSTTLFLVGTVAVVNVSLAISTGSWASARHR